MLCACMLSVCLCYKSGMSEVRCTINCHWTQALGHEGEYLLQWQKFCHAHREHA